MKMYLMAIDECGDEVLVQEYRVPEGEQFTAAELEAYQAVLEMRADVPCEFRSHWWERDFTTKTERQAREAERQARLEELIEEFDGDEDSAWSALLDELRGD